jgi:tetratricopeptide (TPR) repeat protein
MRGRQQWKWIGLASLWVVGTGVGAAPLQQAFEGYRLLNQSRFGDAEVAFRRGLKDRPQSANLRSGLMQSVLGQNRCEEGREMAWKLREKKAFNRNVSDSISGCYARLQNFAEAVYWKEAALTVGGPQVEGWTRLALFRFRLGDDLGAEQALEEAEAMEPGVARPWLTRAVIAVGRGDLDAAERALEWFDLLADEDLQLRWIIAARLSLDLGDLPQALKDLNRAAALGNRTPRGLAVRAEVYRRGGQLEEASATVSVRGGAYMRDRTWRMVLARVRVDEGHLEAAGRLVKEALAEVAADPEVLASAWYLSQHLGETNGAAQYAKSYERVRTNPWRSLSSLLPGAQP